MLRTEAPFGLGCRFTFLLKRPPRRTVFFCLFAGDRDPQSSTAGL